MVVIPDGEKSLDTLTAIWRALSDNNLTRHDTVYAVGGGTVTDIAGFAAATFKRGMHAVYIPTTLLAMADAAIGGKTGIDFNGLKNEVGAFAQPEEIIFDPHFLKTLPQAEILSGYAEMLKTALIADAGLYAALITERPPVAMDGELADEETLIRNIRKVVGIKTRITKEDPTEKGLRKLLNFGHTAGHAYESLSKHEEGLTPLPHGIAVAYGLMTEMILSHLYDGLPSEALHVFAHYLKDHYPVYPFTCKQQDELLSLMAHDKKNAGTGSINFTLLDAIGHATPDHLLTPDRIRPAFELTQDLLR